MNKNKLVNNMLMSSWQFMIRRRKNLLIIAGLLIIVMIVYIVTFENPPIFGISVDKANAIWNIVISLSTSYFVSFIIYYFLVFKQEYLEYKRRINLAPRVYKYFLRTSTYISTFIEMIHECASEEDFAEYKRTFRLYGKIKNRVLPHDINIDCQGLTCDQGLKQACEKINNNMQLLEAYLSILNEDAIKIYTQIQDTYIFENSNNQRDFEGAIDGFLNELLLVEKDIQCLCQKGQYGSINLK